MIERSCCALASRKYSFNLIKSIRTYSASFVIVGEIASRYLNDPNFFVTVRIARHISTYIRDNKGESEEGRAKGNEGRNGRPELHWQGEKDVLSKRTVIRRRGYQLCSKPDSTSAYIIDSRRSVNYPSYRAERAESTTGFS